MNEDIKKYSDMLKIASQAIKDLHAENVELKKAAEAVNIGFSLYQAGNLAAEDLELYIKEASKKELSELSLIKEASALSSTNLDTFGLSSKSETEDNEGDLIGWLLS